MKRFILILLLALSPQPSALGQINFTLNPGSGPVATSQIGYPFGSITGMVAGSSSGTIPATNTTSLNTAIADALRPLPLMCEAKKYWFDGTVVVDSLNGRTFLGNGVPKPTEFNSETSFTSRVYWAGRRTTFDGSTIYADTTGASATIRLYGTSATTKDVGVTLYIDSGTNFTPGTYVVTAVNTSSSPTTWTLDRTCSTGVGAAMVGKAGGTLWRDKGYGSVYKGLRFKGAIAGTSAGDDDTPRAAVLFHNEASNTSGLNPGKIYMENCAFQAGDVGILLGQNMNRAFENAATIDELNHADHFCGVKLEFGAHVGTCVYSRGTQAVEHYFFDYTAEGTSATDAYGRDRVHFYYERGGHLNVTGLLLGGGTLLKMNMQSLAPCGEFTFRNIRYDGTLTACKMLDMVDPPTNNWASVDGGRVTFDGVTFGGSANYASGGPIIVVKGNTSVKLMNAERLVAATISPRGLTSSGGTVRNPLVIVFGSRLDSGVTLQSQLITGAVGSYTVECFGNYNNTTTHFAAQRITQAGTVEYSTASHFWRDARQEAIATLFGHRQRESALAILPIDHYETLWETKLRDLGINVN